jgi:hypothetical protein
VDEVSEVIHPASGQRDTLMTLWSQPPLRACRCS